MKAVVWREDGFRWPIALTILHKEEDISNFVEHSVQAADESVRLIDTIRGTIDCFKPIGQGDKLLTGEFSMLWRLFLLFLM